MKLTDNDILIIKDLCANHKVSRLFVIGSVLTDRFNKDSDIDFVVNFADVPLYEYANNYFTLKYSLEALFKRKIDLLEDQALDVNPYLRHSIDSSKQLIYG
jgi:predicted nucleotidyltransferase